VKGLIFAGIYIKDKHEREVYVRGTSRCKEKGRRQAVVIGEVKLFRPPSGGNI
jgi:hypothetical protein